MKEFAELFDRVKGFNNLEMGDRVRPYMTIYMMNEYSDIPGAVRGATPKEVEVVYDSYPEDICNFIPMILSPRDWATPAVQNHGGKGSVNP